MFLNSEINSEHTIKRKNMSTESIYLIQYEVAHILFHKKRIPLHGR